MVVTVLILGQIGEKKIKIAGPKTAKMIAIWQTSLKCAPILVKIKKLEY